MTEVVRIASLYRQVLEGSPYYGPSLHSILQDIPAEIAASRPSWSAHSIWDLVTHLTAELEYTINILEGCDPGPWVEGVTTWRSITDTSPVAWEQAVQNLPGVGRALIRAIRDLDDRILDQNPLHLRGPYYVMLHGTLQHVIFHTGQISLLRGQMQFQPGSQIPPPVPE